MSRRSSSRPAAYLLGAALSCGVLVGGRLLSAQENQAPTAAESIGQEVRAIFEKCRKAIVRIEAVDTDGALSGTGFFIDPNGSIYTSYTVGGETRDIVVSHGEVKHPANRVVACKRSGVAILKVDAETPFLMPGCSRNLGVASPVVAIGYPMDLPLTPTFGTIGGFDRQYLGRYFATTHIRANVPVQRGQGGAPLLDMRGEVVGVLISSLDSGSACFAVPIEAAEKIRTDFMRFGQVCRGWIGVEVGQASDAVAGSTAQVLDLAEEGPGVAGGLEKGDVILQIGDCKIEKPEDVVDAGFFLTPEDDVIVKIARGDQQLELTLQPGNHPNAPLRQAPAKTQHEPFDEPRELPGAAPVAIGR